MSLSNRHVKVCDPCQAIRLPSNCNPCNFIPCNPCSPTGATGFTGATGACPIDYCALAWADFLKPPGSCRCSDCSKKSHKKKSTKKGSKKCYSSASESSCSSSDSTSKSSSSCSDSHSSSSSEHKSKRNHKSGRKHEVSEHKSKHEKSGRKSRKGKRCGKCHQSGCQCVDIVPCLKTRCGYVAATLTKTASPTTFSGAGVTITYSYTITNQGNAPICYPINICDDRLGGWLIPFANIAPGASQTFTRTYITTVTDTANIVNTATAFIKVTPKKWVCTPPSTATVTFVPV